MAISGGHGEEYDFFLSRRGSVAVLAREVADVLTEEGYKVLVQDYDIPITANFIEAMHEGIKNSRDLVVLFTRDYEQSPYTRKEFTSFEGQRLQSPEQRHIVILRCEDAPLKGLLADNVFSGHCGHRGLGRTQAPHQPALRKRAERKTDHDPLRRFRSAFVAKNGLGDRAVSGHASRPAPQ